MKNNSTDKTVPKNKLSFKTIWKLINNPLSLFPNFGKKSLINFYSLSIWALMLAITLNIIWIIREDIHVAVEKSLPWILTSLAAYAIGSILKAFNVISRQLNNIEEILSSLYEEDDQIEKN